MEDAVIAFLFACLGEESDLGKSSGPLAIAHASRYVEYFEMQIGISPLDMGVYSRVLGSPSLSGTVWDTLISADGKGVLPIVIGDDRRMTEQCCGPPLVALWGKMGRDEADEFAILNTNTAVVAGVRTASANAFKALPTNVTILSSHAVRENKTMFEQALKELSGPVHLSIDFDVLSPGVAQTNRSLEPGGLCWYDLMDMTDMVFQHPGVASVDLVGTKHIVPQSTSALIGAQLLMHLAGVAAAGITR